MMSEGSRLPNYSIPSLVEKLLNTSSGKSFTCINFGVGGTSCKEALNLLINRSLKIAKPDYVIFYDGWNCASYLTLSNQLLSLAEQKYPDIPITEGETIRQFENNITLDKVFSYSYCLSRLIKMSIGEILGFISPRESKIEHLIGKVQDKFFSLRSHSELQRLAKKIDYERFMNKSVKDSVLEYIDIHQYAQAITNSFDIKFITFLQPLIFWGSKKLTAHEYEFAQTGLSSGNPEQFKLFKRVLMSKIQKSNFYEAFINLTDVFDKYEEEIYTDSGHVNRLGNLIVSERITQEILKKL